MVTPACVRREVDDDPPHTNKQNTCQQQNTIERKISSMGWLERRVYCWPGRHGTEHIGTANANAPSYYPWDSSCIPSHTSPTKSVWVREANPEQGVMVPGAQTKVWVSPRMRPSLQAVLCFGMVLELGNSAQRRHLLRCRASAKHESSQVKSRDSHVYSSSWNMSSLPTEHDWQ
jgi:hypothetical protein